MLRMLVKLFLGACAAAVALTSLFIGILIAGVLTAFPVMWLWNYVVPYIFPGTVTLGFFQAWALAVLCGALFKSSSSK